MFGQIGKKERAYVTYDEIDALQTTPRKRNWKPFAIKAPFLASLALLCLLSIVLLEILLRHSKQLDKSYLDALNQLKRSVELPVAHVVARPHVRPARTLVARATPVSTTSSSVQSTTTPWSTKPTTAYPAIVTTTSRVTSTKPVVTTRRPTTLCPTSTTTAVMKVVVGRQGQVIRRQLLNMGPSDSCVATTTSSYTFMSTDYLSLTSVTTSVRYAVKASPVLSSSTSVQCPTSSVTISVTVWNDGKNPPVTVTNGAGPVNTCVKSMTMTLTLTDSYLKLTSVTTSPSVKTMSATATVPNFVPLVPPTPSTSATTPAVDKSITSQSTPSVVPPTTTGYLQLTSKLPSQTTPNLPQLSSTIIVSTNGPSSTGVALFPYVSVTTASLGSTANTVVSAGGVSSTMGSLSIYGSSTTSNFQQTPAGALTATTSVAPITFISDGSPYLQLTSAPASNKAISSTIAILLTPSSSTGYRQISTSTVLAGIAVATSTPSDSGIAKTNVVGVSTTQPPSIIATASDRNRVTTTFRSIDDTQPLTITSLSTSEDGQVITFTAVIRPSSTISQPSATSNNAQSTSATTLQQITNLRQPDMLVDGIRDFRENWYFACIYLPSLIAVILKEAWSMTAAGLKMTEPFYQLNRPDGASVHKSLMADYLGSTNSLYSITRALKGDMLMLGTLVITVVMNFLAPLSTESMTVIPLYIWWDDKGHRQSTNPGWVLSRFFVRVLQGLLSVLLCVFILIAGLDRKRRSGLSANPSKIATMASLCNHPDMVRELNRINPNASDKEIAAFIAHSRYKTTAYQDSQGDSLYSVVKVGETTPQGVHRLAQEDMDDLTGSAGAAPERNRTQRAIWRRLVDGLLMILIIGLLAVLIAYWRDNTASAFNNYFNSRGFGPRFILSLCASITVTVFQSMEHEVRLLTPYRRLVARNASPDGTVLRSVNGTAVSNLFQNIKHRTWFGLFVALVTVLGNLLIIMIAGVPFSASVTLQSVITSLSISVFILVLMLIMAITVFLWRWKNKKMRIPTEPNGSLLRTWMSLSNPGNQLRALFNEPGDKSGTSLKARVKGEGGEYWAGWVEDARRRNMWCVDKEYPVVSAQYDNIEPARGAELDNQNTRPGARRSNFSWRSRRNDTSQTLPFIQTEYREDPVQHVQPDNPRRNDEQTNLFIQTEYRENLVDLRESPDRSHGDTMRHHEQGDISLRENARREYPHVQTAYREHVGRSGNGGGGGRGRTEPSLI